MSFLLAGIAGAFTAGSAAQEQDGQVRAAGDEDPVEIVVTGLRGAVRTRAKPIATLDADAIAATGATSTGELLRAIQATTQSADGGEPIFLLNAQRVSGYQEISTLPPEAIERVEVLPEPVALQFGYPPTRRIVNFITKRRFRQLMTRAELGTTTRGGSPRGKIEAGLTRLRDDSRLTLAMEYRHTDPLLQSRRAIDPDPDVLFDAIGNLTAPGGGEIDPALSAAAGGIVTVAPVPEAPGDRLTLEGFAEGANQPRLFDLGRYRTLIARNDAVKGDMVLGGPIGAGLAGTLSLSAEQSRNRTLHGPAPVTLTIPGGTSLFAEDVLLRRYLVEADPLRSRETTTTLQAGGTLRGAVGGWRWDLTGALDQKQTEGRSERGIDTNAIEDAIAGGIDPFAPFAAGLLDDRLVDHARLRTRTAGAKTVFASPPVALPAGDAALTATAEIEHASADSETRGANPFDLSLARTRTEAGVAIDVPLVARDEGALGGIGNFSASASANVRDVSSFGSLHDTTLALNWAPIEGVQLLATLKNSGAAPGLEQLSSPVVRLPNVAVFDYSAGRTEIVTMTQGGNPDLLAERRRVSTLALNLKPFPTREIRVSATYEATTVRDQTGVIYAVTPEVEAIFPELVTRDASGRLTAVTVQPVNFYRQRQQLLKITLGANGQIGEPPPPPAVETLQPPPPRPSYYAGAGPTFRFSDKLELRPGAPVLDLLDGDTVAGWPRPAFTSYFYGGVNHKGHGLTLDGWYGGGGRVRGDNPASDLRFSPVFKVNVAAYVNVHQVLKDQDWTKRMQLRVDVQNVTDDRQEVVDGNGEVPYRFQPGLLDPAGRVVSLSLRKLF